MSTPYVTYVRHVRTDERSIVSSDTLWHVDTDKKVRWLFKPTEVGAYDPKEEFGVVQEDKIVFHHILLMAKDREDLREKLKTQKVRVVKRRSFFHPVEEPLAGYTVKEEKAIVQQKKTAATKAGKNVVAEDKIMKVFNKNKPEGKKAATATAVTDEGTAAAFDEASTTPYHILEELWGDGKSSTPKPERRMKPIGVESLQTQLDSCTLSDLRKDVNALSEEHRRLQTYIHKREEQLEGLISSMTSFVKDLPDVLVQRMVDLKIQAPKECFLMTDLKVPKEAEFEAVPVSDDEWYMGAGFTLKKSIVKDIQAENYAKRYGRLTALFRAVYRDNAVRYSVSGECDAGEDRHYNALIDRKIPSCHYESFAKVMTFLETPDSQGVIKQVTPKEIKLMLYKIPTDLRRRADRENETEEQKKMRLRIEREERLVKKKEKERMAKKRSALPQGGGTSEDPCSNCATRRIK